MDSARIRTVEFRQAVRGYDRCEVDDLLEAVAKAVDVGRPPMPLLRGVEFRHRWAGYHRRDVDEFLDILRTATFAATAEPWFPPPSPVKWGADPQAIGPLRSAVPSHPNGAGVPSGHSSGTDPSRTVRGRIGGVLFGLPALVFYGAVLLGLVGWSIATFVSDQIQDARFARTGVVIHPRVVARYHDDEGQDGAYDYLYVVIPACNCKVELPTTNLAGHPVGSRVPVRYDPKHPSDARILVDGNNGWLADLVPASFDVLVLWFFGYMAVGSVLGVRRENRRILQNASTVG